MDDATILQPFQRPPVAVIEKEPSAGGVVSASDALNVAKPGFHAISFACSAPSAAADKIDVRPNWKEQSPSESLTGKQWR